MCETCGKYLGFLGSYWDYQSMPSGKYCFKAFFYGNNSINCDVLGLSMFVDGEYSGIENAILSNVKAYDENYNELNTFINDGTYEFATAEKCLCISKETLQEVLEKNESANVYIVIDIPEEYVGVRIGFSAVYGYEK